MTQVKNNVSVLILTGDGVNCEVETAWAFREVGAKTTIEHINDLEGRPESIHSFDIMVLPGGFSFGDDLGSGKIFALKIKKYLGKHFEDFISQKKPILGICNGFQVLTKLGAFTRFQTGQVGLAQNSNAQFIDKWVELKVEDSPCIWTKDMKKIKLPIRHGEGRFVAQSMPSTFYKVLSYVDNPNGSHENIAAICDESGLIFGLMPHPEAALTRELHPGGKISESHWGLHIFKNAVDYMKNKDRA